MTGKRALIVDDAPTAVEVLRRSLAQMDIDCDGVDSAEAALEYLGDADDMPDYVFMDVMMPGMNGFDATEKILSEEKTEKLPVIIYTTLNRSEDKSKAKAVGASAFLSKPFSQADLAKCMSKV
jgi:twitching motility two-component system response regulator PilH